MAWDTIDVALVQLQSGRDYAHNIKTALALCDEGKSRGAQWIALPENALFLGMEGEAHAHASALDASPLVAPFRAWAKENERVVFLGSVPERSESETRAFNTSVLIDRHGDIAASYRKVHLFDVELPDGTAIRESDGWLAGERPVVVEVDGCRVGLSICYDLRFPEHYRKMVDDGVEVIMVPSAFTLQTGKDHWQPLLQARAIENQCYVVAAAQWGEHFPGRTTWGKSMAIDPWGNVLACAPERASVVVARLERAAQERVRERFPSLKHRRSNSAL